jgi:hypothetical protein
MALSKTCIYRSTENGPFELVRSRLDIHLDSNVVPSISDKYRPIIHRQ